MAPHFQPAYPVSPLLKDHIYCYYTLGATSGQFKSAHYSFPHTYNAVSLYRGAAIKCCGSGLKVKGNGTDNIFCVLQGKRQHPLLVEMEGAFSRITILFKPLGINNFISQSLSSIMGPNPGLLTAWNLPADLFIDGQPQIGVLEDFLCSQYMPINQPALQQALVLLDDFEQEMTVAQIASAVGLSLRSFNRQFKTYIGVSPVTHQRIARFRHSLENKLFHDKYNKLAEIGYQSNFYDQSYFIKLYNQLAGANPGALFNKLEQIGDSKLVFEFKDL